MSVCIGALDLVLTTKYWFSLQIFFVDNDIVKLLCYISFGKGVDGRVELAGVRHNFTAGIHPNICVNDGFIVCLRNLDLEL